MKCELPVLRGWSKLDRDDVDQRVTKRNLLRRHQNSERKDTSMIRKLIFTAAALVALSAGAQAGNTVTTTQVGGLNVSSTTQVTAFSTNSATLSQFGGVNVGSANQINFAGLNSNTMFQDSEANSNSAAINQFNPFGTNLNNVTQVP
jgi:hypothetical protein